MPLESSLRKSTKVLCSRCARCATVSSSLEAARTVDWCCWAKIWCRSVLRTLLSRTSGRFALLRKARECSCSSAPPRIAFSPATSTWASRQSWWVTPMSFGDWPFIRTCRNSSPAGAIDCFSFGILCRIPSCGAKTSASKYSRLSLRPMVSWCWSELSLESGWCLIRCRESCCRNTPMGKKPFKQSNALRTVN